MTTATKERTDTTTLELTISGKTLGGVLGKMGKLYSGRGSIMQILDGVVLEAQDGGIVLKGTNLQTAVTRRSNAMVLTEGKACLPYRQLVDFLGQLGDQVVNIRVTPTTATITAGRAKTSLLVYDVDDFPALPQRERLLFEASANQLVDAMTSVIPAAAKDDTRPVLSCVCLMKENGHVGVVSADGYRLHTADLHVPISDWDDEIGELLVQRPAAQAILDMLDADGGNVVVYSGGNRGQLILLQDDTEIGVTLVEGKFPNYRPIIPPATGRAFVSEVGTLRDAVNIVTAPAKRTSDTTLNVSIPVDGDEIRLWMRGNDIAKETENFVTVELSGEGAMDVMLNLNYLKEMVAALPKEAKVEFGFNAPTTPVRVRSVNDQGTPFLGVIMPLGPTTR